MQNKQWTINDGDYKSKLPEYLLEEKRITRDKQLKQLLKFILLSILIVLSVYIVL